MYINKTTVDLKVSYIDGWFCVMTLANKVIERCEEKHQANEFIDAVVKHEGDELPWLN